MASKKRRGNGEGSICQRNDGRWMARITVGFTPAGKRSVRTVYGRTRREVQEKLLVLQHQKATGTLTDAGKMTVGEWITHWHETISTPRVRPSTAAAYHDIIKCHILPRIGGIKLSKFSPVNLQAMYAEMERDGKTARMRQKVHAVLRRAFNVAMKQGMLQRNPCHFVDVPKYQAPEMKTLTPEQAAKLVKTSEGGRFHALIVLAVTTGMRQGELFGLKWEDVDLEAGQLSVRRSLSYVRGKLSFSRPKSKAGTRSLRLPDIAVKVLWDHKALMVKEGFAGSELIFCDTEGNPLRNSNFYRRYYKPLLKRAEVPDIRFHDLRHTSATLMLADNVHPKIVQQRLGHSQIALTLDTYSHVLPTMDEAAAGTFDRLMG